MFTNRLRLALAALAAASALTACAGTGAPDGDRDPGRRPPGAFTERIDHDGFADIGYRLLWTGSAVMTRGARVRHAAVEGDAVLIQETGNVVSLLQTEDGRSRWSTTLGAPLTRFTGLARTGDRALVSSDVDLYILSIETGDLLDRQNLDLVVNTRPLVADGAAFFGSTTGRVLAHDLRTGLGRWQYQLSGSINASPVAVGDNVGVVSSEGDVIILRPRTGSATARAKVFGAPAGAPDAASDLIAFASRDQSAYAFNAADGQRLWRYRTPAPLSVPLRLIDGVAYFAIPGQGMIGLDALTGDEVWSAEDITGEVVGLVGENVLVRAGDRLTALDPRGDVVSTVTTPGLFDVIMPDPSGGDFYLVTEGGDVSRFVRR